MALLRCRDLVRRPWFDSLSLALEPGEIAVLRGASGSGKTLLLRTLADLDPADGGTVELDGRARESFTPSAWRRDVLYVHPGGVRLEGSVRENVERTLALRANAARAPERSGERAAQLHGVDPDAPAARLSTGEGERLALARALAVGPRVLLLDEPTGGLDDERARAVESTLARWVAEGRAILWVSHDADLPRRVGARTIAFP